MGCFRPWYYHSRFRPNLTLGQGTFDEDDVTCTSIVSLPFVYENMNIKPEIIIHRHSCMPDNAAGVFAPGWDVGTDNIEFPENSDEELFVTVGYRLGSLFPEDAKLCAALSTFWPAVAPDVSRTFGPTFSNQRNVCPLTDKEIGIDGDLPWDGVTGPINTGSKVEYTLFEYADYTINALHDKFSVHELSKVDFKEYTSRIIAMAKVRRYSELLPMESSGNPYSVISFKSGSDVQDELADASSNFTNPLKSPYRFRVCTYSDIDNPAINHNKSIFTIEDNFTIFADGDLQSDQIWIKRGQGGDWISGSWNAEQITL